MKVDDLLAQGFSCSRCEHKGAHAERLSMSGTGLVQVRRRQ